jgi:hypothetical protein
MARDARLTRPLKPTGAPAIASVRQACDYILELPDRIAMQTVWQHAARLAIEAREHPTAEMQAARTEQLELALFMTARLDLNAEWKRPPASSVRASPRLRKLA